MAKTGPEVLLLRHGQTEWSLNGRHTGSTDIPLTEEGRVQARALHDRLAGREFALVLTSPLGRARETAELAGLGAQAQVREDLLEWNYGDYEGVTTADIRKQDPDWLLWRDGCPGGETAADVGARVDRLIAEVRAAGGDCALFGHGHVLRVLAARWVDLAPAEGGRFGLSTATVSVMGWEREVPVFWLWNGAGHLGPAAGGGGAESL
jgi:broad specificity phosphatase PhoE